MDPTAGSDQHAMTGRYIRPLLIRCFGGKPAAAVGKNFRGGSVVCSLAAGSCRTQNPGLHKALCASRAIEHPLKVTLRFLRMPNGSGARSGIRVDQPGCNPTRALRRAINQEDTVVFRQPQCCADPGNTGTRNYDVRMVRHGTKSGSVTIRPCATVPVAQLDRASDYGSEGWGFESSRARIDTESHGSPNRGLLLRRAHL